MNAKLIELDAGPKKELKKSTRAKLALLGSIKGVCKDFYSQTSSATVPSMYLNFLNKDQEGEDELVSARDQDINPEAQLDGQEQSGDAQQSASVQYGRELGVLWENLRGKLVEKLRDSHDLMTEELRQLHGRNRQFYKVTLGRTELDKFDPGDRAVKTQFPTLTNFHMTALLYEDK